MPLQPLDFSRFLSNPDYSGLANVFDNYYKGMEQAETPEKMARQRIKEELMNSLYGEQLQGQQISNEYAPQEKQLGIENSQLGNEKAQLENEFYGEKQQSEIDYKNAMIKKFLAEAENEQLGMKNLTTNQKELADLYGYGTPEYEKALKKKHGTLEGVEIPEGAVPLDLMSPGERNEATKIMRQNLKVANDLTKAHKTLEKMKLIIDQHPNMGDYFAHALIHPDEKASIIDQYKRRWASKEEQTAIEQFTKHSNDLILSAGQALGSKNFTDGKMKLLALAKPSARNTAEANKYVIEHMLYEFEPYAAYGKAIQHGLKNRYEVLDDPQAYRTKDTPEAKLAAELSEGLEEEEMEDPNDPFGWVS